jgi:hypothetical protein
MRDADARASAGLTCAHRLQTAAIRRQQAASSAALCVLLSAKHARSACWGLGAGAAQEGHLVDALVPRGDEGRGTLRKAEGRGERPVILGCPNGATHRLKRDRAVNP